MNYSINPKLNAVMKTIELQLLSKGTDKQEALQIIRQYIKAFPKEPDYNLAQYGGMLVSPYDVRELNIQCGYSSLPRIIFLMKESGTNTCFEWDWLQGNL